jgi:hypothetical protein
MPEDIYKGKVSKLALQKSVICGGCDGRGGKEGAVKEIVRAFLGPCSRMPPPNIPPKGPPPPPPKN